MLVGRCICIPFDRGIGEPWTYRKGPASERVRSILMDSVDLRMRSDVPFGAFLSGGIDSSAVVALMSEVGQQPVSTFNIAFHEDEFDESQYCPPHRQEIRHGPSRNPGSQPMTF